MSKTPQIKTESNYIQLDDGIFRYDYTNPENPSMVKVCNNCFIIQHYENIETGAVYVDLTFNPVGLRDDFKIERVNADVIVSEAKLETLAGKGFDYNNTERRHIIAYLRESRLSAGKIDFHRNLGFQKEGNDWFFKHHTTIGKSTPSEYQGTFNLKPTGEYARWIEMVKAEVIPSIPLQLAVAIGLSSGLLGYIGLDLALESEFVHIYGDSSTGKTTATQLIASIWGCPNPRDKGSLHKSWNATPNAIFAILGNNFGIPIVFDELSLANLKDYSNIIYSFSEGREKSRMNASAELRDVRTFLTTVVSSGEYSIFDKSRQAVGLRARVLELDNISWTLSSTSSEKIKQTVMKNYGHGGPRFVKYLMGLGQDVLIKKYEVVRRNVIDKLPSSTIKERISSKLALILLSADIAREIFGLPFDYLEIEKLLTQQIGMTSEQADLPKQAFLRLLDYLAERREDFEIRCPSLNNQGTEYSFPKAVHKGVLIYNDCAKANLAEIQISTSLMKDILEKTLGFESSKVIISAWKKRGWMDCEHEKTYRKRKVNGMTLRVHILNARKIYEDLNLKLTNKSTRLDKLNYYEVKIDDL